MKNFIKNENGELVVESVIVLVTSLMAIFILINASLFSYQRGNVVATANQVASDIAATYAYSHTEPYIGYVSKDKLIYRNYFRYLNIDKYNKQEAKKVKWYAFTLLTRNELLIKPGVENRTGDVSVTFSDSYYGYKKVKVKIERTYPVLAVNPMEIFGIKPEAKCRAEGNAICYDMLDYMAMEHGTEEVKYRLLKDSLIESVAGAINGIWDLVDTISEIVKPKES